MGFIYVATPPLSLGIVKIGFTERSVVKRMQEIEKNEGVPGKYKIEYEFEIDNAINIESIIHGELKEFRYLVNKEFFMLSPSIASLLVKTICEREKLRQSLVTKKNIPLFDTKEVGLTIRSYRKNNKMTQAMLANKAKVLPKTISAIENGSTSVLFETLIKVFSTCKLKMFFYNEE